MSPLGSTQCTTITITVDDVTEPEETFSVTLVPVSDFVTLGNTTTSSVVIDDNDRKCLPARPVSILANSTDTHVKALDIYNALSHAVVAVSMFVLDDEFGEEEGAGLVCVILSQGQLDGISVTVTLSTSEVSASNTSEYIMEQTMVYSYMCVIYSIPLPQLTIHH